MIKINDNWEFEHDGLQWQLHQWRHNTNPDAKHKRVKTTTYHPKLNQVAEHIIEREVGKCKTAEEIIRLLSPAVWNFTLHLKGLVDADTAKTGG